MDNDSWRERISSNPDVCHGTPCIRGTRVMVWLILQYLSNGDTVEEVVAAHPGIAREDVLACMGYAADRTRDRLIVTDAAT